MDGPNPYTHLIANLGDKKYFNIAALNNEKYEKLPFCIRILLESAIRNCDNFQVTQKDVENILNWEINQNDTKGVEVQFKPARVILQDFTGVPAVVDFAAMRDAVKRLGGDPDKINPICPVDLVIDHSVQVDFSRTRLREEDPGGGDAFGCGGCATKRGCVLARGHRGTRYLRSNRYSHSTTPNSMHYRHGSSSIGGSPNRPSSPITPNPMHYRQGTSSIGGSPSRPTSPLVSGTQSLPINQLVTNLQPAYLVIPGHIASVQPCTSTIGSGPSTINQSGVSEMQINSTPYSQFVSQPVPIVYGDCGYVPISQPTYSVQPQVAYTPNNPGNAQYYPGSSYVLMPPASTGSRPPTPEVLSQDIEDESCGRSRSAIAPKRYTISDEKSSGITGPSGPSLKPTVKVPLSDLPSPQDIPGIPVQDTVCPFHLNSSKWSDALQKNEEVEFQRNRERFLFLKWGSQALKNMFIVPPGSGIVHQVNLEYLARVVFNKSELIYPDSLVGTDSHTTMINGLGVVGWGVGGIEAEAVMLGQAISMVLPKVIGYKIKGELSPLATSTDVVLTITKHLRTIGVVGKFVEFFGPGVEQLSLADRATVSNMCPEYGATIGFFPVDDITISYLRQSNRSDSKIEAIETYLKAVKMYRNYADVNQDPVFSEIVELDLADVVPSLSGPKRPHDRVPVSTMKIDFNECLGNKVGFKGFGIPVDQHDKTIPFMYDGMEYTIKHGSVVIAAITSCTNTSNPSVMLGAGLLAKNAVEAGLSVAPYIKTSLSPGSGVVTHYLQHSGVTPYLQKLGFDIVGYGCMTCIGNSGPLPESVAEAIEKNDLVCCGVLSGNRNFEGRIHPSTRANYLASPLLVIAYAIAGTVDIDFETQPIGHNDGKDIFLRDIWPTRSFIQEVEKKSVLPTMFADVYNTITTGNARWNKLEAPTGDLYPWDPTSTYIKSPPFFEGMAKEQPSISEIKNARVLLNLGDSVTTDHISPAGSIARNSPAARYLANKGLAPREFNSYGSRRGNDAIMSRGTFANIRLVNKFIGKAGPKTIHLPSNEQMDIYDAAEKYKSENTAVIVLAGKEYGSGSSRDWAAKGPYLLGIRAVIAESYERIHRSNLIGMGIVPLQYLDGQNADTLKLTGKESYTLVLPDKLVPGQEIAVNLDDGRQFTVLVRFDTEVELNYYYNGGILQYMIRKMID